ncbi:MAG: peptidylprolyl isomerase [Bacteroidales bacterium]|jgi:peptidyl-prolyl cis-trans isomerase B (cyclophilin B)|nr:peptidylprolyl isomerase [Bacteroidales bacterium]MCI2122206.1 peptidylprolyl isomerase [Bacteroidales bacterium]MCI2145782.1 peptidylprolyl isomerase [Bacteroidales bacterium]
MKSDKLMLMATVALAALVLFGCKPKVNKTTENNAIITKTVPAFNPDSLAAEPVFRILTSDGTITVKLYSDTPLHRNNFEKLASQRYYDGMLFHRVINGFMIQTGDPYSKDSSKWNLLGTGGPGYTIPAEILSNHIHKKGALAAARRGDEANPQRESSGSQFYIVQNENNCKQLDGAYTVFGETVEGFDVIDKIAAEPTDSHDRPRNDVKIISILPVNQVAKDAAAKQPAVTKPAAGTKAVPENGVHPRPKKAN